MKSALQILSKATGKEADYLQFANEVECIRPSEALEAMSEFASQGREWIEIKEGGGLPKESGLVLGCMKDTLDIYVCYYKKQLKLFQVWGAGRDPITDMKVTHWMLLPEPPKNS